LDRFIGLNEDVGRQIVQTLYLNVMRLVEDYDRAIEIKVQGFSGLAREDKGLILRIYY
jgi:hypothetical protein